MRNDYYSNSKDYLNRWVVSYADLVTMLLALFMVMFAVSQNVTKSQQTHIEKQDAIIAQNSAPADTKELEALRSAIEKKAPSSDNITLLNESRGVVIRLNNSVLFDEGSAIIKPEAQKTLNDIIEVLSQMGNSILIEGHTDTTPINTKQYPSNWELSTARATNIITYIAKTGKISPKRLSAVGYGEYMPVADNTSVKGRLLNRRVDIIVLRD